MTQATGFDVTVGSGPGYLAVPSGTGPWPGVVVIHESWGLNTDIRASTHRLGSAGYLALAPDLYEGRSFVRCFRGVFRQLHAGSGPVFDAIDAVRTALTDRPDCTGKVGVLGFCMGGGFALLCAPRGEFCAASVNYGEVPDDAERVLAGSCPMVASYGGRDLMGAAPPRRLETALTALDVAHDVKVYPGAGHSFMSPKPAWLTPLARLARLDFKPEAAEDSWHRILAFFGEHLGGDFPGGRA